MSKPVNLPEKIKALVSGKNYTSDDRRSDRPRNGKNYQEAKSPREYNNLIKFWRR